MFDGKAPPQGGHPGEAWGCRCHAEPLIEDLGDWQPLSGLALRRLTIAAELDGMGAAAGDFAAGIVEGISELPARAAWLTRYFRLRVEEALGTLDRREAAELADKRAQIDTRIDAIGDFLRHAPDIAAALADYARAVERRPALITPEYEAGRATEAQLAEAYRERAYLETTLILNLAPGAALTRLLRRRGRRGDTADPDPLRDDLLDEAARARRLPADVDWPVIANPGIVWGRGIADQGDPWEDALAAMGQLGERLPPGFKTFDFHDAATRTATSAKTLDTGLKTYLSDPRQVFHRLKHYIDTMARFSRSNRRRYPLESDEIDHRRLELAVPVDSLPEQFTQIQRAIDYAAERDMIVEVTLIDG
ncbi:MAG TPA: hypothetical protein DDY29_00470 [Rhodobacteraceae bacterium]|nr:hypothetical protein [Paracoccaceae bacterium]